MKVVGMRGVVLRPQYIAEGIAGAIPRCPQELSHFSLVIPVANQRNLTSVWFLEPLQPLPGVCDTAHPITPAVAGLRDNERPF